MQDTLPDFSRKVVYVFFDTGEPSSRAAVENPRFELQGGELFLVGRGLTKRAWGSDVPLAIAWSRIQWYSVFESAQAFEEAYDYNKREKQP